MKKLWRKFFGKKRVRGFEVVAPWARTVSKAQVILPHRATQGSAGYDFHALETWVIAPGAIQPFFTDVKAYMPMDEVLHLYPRSSVGIKLGLMLANTVPTVDADYYGNPDNDGHIIIYLRNLNNYPVTVRAGDRIAQGVFEKYLIADNDPEDLPLRQGGVGSTGR